MIETPRLLLHGWRDADIDPWAVMNADPAVMEHFPSVLTPAQSGDAVTRWRAHLDEHGFGPWAVERREDGVFLGFAGLVVLKPENPLAPGVEAGWRFARHAWGQGYASEAARAALEFGFREVGLDTIVAFTATTNLRSQAVMDRIGMTRREDLDFDHPALPKGHRLERHLVWAADAP